MCKLLWERVIKENLTCQTVADSWVDDSYLPRGVDGTCLPGLWKAWMPWVDDSYLPGGVDGTCLPRFTLPGILKLVGQWNSMLDLVRSLSKKLSGCENDSVWLWKSVPMGWEFFSLLWFSWLKELTNQLYVMLKINSIYSCVKCVMHIQQEWI